MPENYFKNLQKLPYKRKVKKWPTLFSEQKGWPINFEVNMQIYNKDLSRKPSVKGGKFYTKVIWSYSWGKQFALTGKFVSSFCPYAANHEIGSLHNLLPYTSPVVASTKRRSKVGEKGKIRRSSSIMGKMQMKVKAKWKYLSSFLY